MLADFDDLIFEDNSVLSHHILKRFLKLCDLLVITLQKDIRFHTVAVHVVLSKFDEFSRNSKLLSELLDESYFDLTKMEGKTVDIYRLTNFLTSSNIIPCFPYSDLAANHFTI